MEITFDPAKDAANTAKHGVSLALAEQFEWDSAVVWPDTRRNYGEARMVALGYIADRLFCVAFVDRPDARRIISLRKANSREVNRYAKT
ncbi:BrnT family toxin [Niveibacterium sp. SC-1]|uniref:BrnT family toxin n=1 Tax=Niveibacterium sp. SC-1 TaxID=3135646 RepID=UPI00311FBC9B